MVMMMVNQEGEKKACKERRWKEALFGELVGETLRDVEVGQHLISGSLDQGEERSSQENKTKDSNGRKPTRDILRGVDVG